MTQLKQTDEVLTASLADLANEVGPIRERPDRRDMSLPVKVCPYLGSWDDPETARSYVTDANCCYHVRPATTVKADHQRAYCLTYHHVHCPIFRHETEIKLPSRHLEPYRRAKYIIPIVVVCVIFILAAVIVVTVPW